MRRVKAGRGGRHGWCAMVAPCCAWSRWWRGGASAAPGRGRGARARAASAPRGRTAACCSFCIGGPAALCKSLELILFRYSGITECFERVISIAIYIFEVVQKSIQSREKSCDGAFYYILYTLATWRNYLLLLNLTPFYLSVITLYDKIKRI